LLSGFRSVFILGGIEGPRFRRFQQLIQDLSRDDEGFENDDEELQNYGDFLKSIKLLNSNFNLNAKKATITGDCSVDIIIDLNNLNEQRLVLLQRVKRINGWNILNAVIVFNIQNHQAQFAITPTITGTYKEKIVQLKSTSLVVFISFNMMKIIYILFQKRIKIKIDFLFIDESLCKYLNLILVILYKNLIHD
jgi:hypothetical protein